jgi:transposase-like protein
MVGKRRRVNTLTPDDLQRVANAYTTGGKGMRTENVIRECGPMSTRTARRWIQQARDAGYLPPKLDADNGKDI